MSGSVKETTMQRIALVTLLLVLIWVIGGLFMGFDFPVWFDWGVGLLFFSSFAWNEVTQYFSEQKSIKKMVAERAQLCVNCGKDWHTLAEDTSILPTFSTRRKMTQTNTVSGTCDCIDGHEYNCPQAPV